MASSTADQVEDVRQRFDSFPTSTLNNYFPLVMAIDKKTEMYIKFAKVMVIFQGPYIPERSEAIEVLKKKFNYASRVLSDITYSKEMNTPCDISHAEDFYNYFETEAKISLEEGNNLLIIDATLSNMKLNKYYTALANKMQYVILIVPPVVSGGVSDSWPKGSQAASFRKSGTFIHSSTMYKHLFCGWFLHDIDSHELRHEAALYINDCIENIPEFKKIFESNITRKVEESADGVSGAAGFYQEDLETPLMDRIKNYYRLEDKRQDLARCVVKVFTKMFEMNEYFKMSEVKKHYGKMSKLLIAGFIITPNMIAARVKLTANHKELFQMVDELDEKGKIQPPLPSELLRNSKAMLSSVDVKLISSKSNQTLINSGKHVEDPLEVFKPFVRGKSCHFLLASTANASFLNIDYDVALALRRESDLRKKDREPEPYDLERSIVKKIGKYWFIYLKEMLVVDAFFASSVEAYPYENAIGRIGSER